MDDRKIVELFWKRDESALSESARKYGALCMSISLNILGNTEDAQECLNDTLSKAWNSIPPQRPSSLKAYLASIARNTSLNVYRNQSAQKRGGGNIAQVQLELEESFPGFGTIEHELESKELSLALNEYLEGLPREKRQMFVCRYWYADSVSDIARRFGKSDAAVASILGRLRKKLKKHLSERGFTL